jgi:hypothetical protein
LWFFWNWTFLEMEIFGNCLSMNSTSQMLNDFIIDVYTLEVWGVISMILWQNAFHMTFSIHYTCIKNVYHILMARIFESIAISCFRTLYYNHIVELYIQKSFLCFFCYLNFFKGCKINESRIMLYLYIIFLLKKTVKFFKRICNFGQTYNVATILCFNHY